MRDHIDEDTYLAEVFFTSVAVRVSEKLIVIIVTEILVDSTAE